MYLGAFVTAAFLMPLLSIQAKKSSSPGSGSSMEAAQHTDYNFIL